MNETIKTILERSRRLRKQPTPAEEELWKYLRKRQFYGLRFLRQHPIKFTYDKKINYFIADFYCHAKKLIIELDGGVHKKQKECDQMRDDTLEQMGFEMVRFQNKDILENIEFVLQTIHENIL